MNGADGTKYHADPSQSQNAVESISKGEHQPAYRIGDLAREFEVTLRTLRFYEDRGLIIPKRAGTTRLYSESDRDDLRIVLFCKRIGLSLGNIRNVLDLHRSGLTQTDAIAQLRPVYANQLRFLQLQQSKTDAAISELTSALSDIDRD